MSSENPPKVRSNVVGDWVKRLHDFTCQICETRLETPAGAYAETCHIRPVDRPITVRTLLRTFLAYVRIATCFLDGLSRWINDDCSLGGTDGLLRANSLHTTSTDAIQYHRRMCGH